MIKELLRRWYGYQDKAGLILGLSAYFFLGLSTYLSTGSILTGIFGPVLFFIILFISSAVISLILYLIVRALFESVLIIGSLFSYLNRRLKNWVYDISD